MGERQKKQRERERENVRGDPNEERETNITAENWKNGLQKKEISRKKK